jgi:hypothetical protein
MKKVIALLFFAAFTASAFAQGLFKPVPKDLFVPDASSTKALVNTSVWLPRISAGVVANQFTYNKETKKLDMTAFSKVGLGLSYAHFVPVNDLPYNNFSVNGFVFFPTNDSGLSFVISASALQYISLGLGYDVKLKTVFGLTGIVYTF